MLRVVVLFLLVTILGCGPAPAAQDPKPPPQKELPPLASMLPEGATSYVQADDVRLLVRRAAGKGLARDVPQHVTRAAFAIYGDAQMVGVLQTDRPDKAKFGKRYIRVGTTPSGAAHYRQAVNPPDRDDPPLEILWYEDRATVVGAPASMVEEIDAVVAGTKPSLSVPAGGGLAHGFTTKTWSLVTGTTTFSLVDAPRLVVDVRATMTQAHPTTSVLDMVRRLPSDTIAFEAHAMPKDVMTELIVPWGQSLIEERFGVDLTELLEHAGGNAVVAVVADTPRDQLAMEQLFDRGLVFLLQAIDDATDAQELIPNLQKKVAGALGADKVQMTERGFVVELARERDRVLTVEIVEQHLWVSAGPRKLSARVHRDVFSGEHNFQRKEVLDALSDASFGVWVDGHWLDEAVREDAPFIRHGDGEALTSARATGTRLSATIDAALVEDVLRVGLRWGLENMIRSIAAELVGD